MRRLIFSNLSVLLVFAATTPAFAAHQVEGAKTTVNSSALTLLNPPAEVPSSSLLNLDPSSARQPKALMSMTTSLSKSLPQIPTNSATVPSNLPSQVPSYLAPNPPAEVPSPSLQDYQV